VLRTMSSPVPRAPSPRCRCGAPSRRVLNAGSVACLVLGVVIGLSASKVFNIGGVTPVSSPVQHDAYKYKYNYSPGSGSSNSGVLHNCTDADQSSHVKPRQISMKDRGEQPMSILEEYIPPSLRHVYEPGALQFNVTRAMLRQSRPVIGNVQRLHAYLRKLQSKQCTTVLILGGSVSDGHHVKEGPKYAYPQNFVNWLNERYPCLVNGTKGTHAYKKTHASSSQRHFTSWAMVSGIETFDLVMFEFNVNGYPPCPGGQGRDGRKQR